MKELCAYLYDYLENINLDMCDKADSVCNTCPYKANGSLCDLLFLVRENLRDLNLKK
jgi:hypothetical protein